MRETVKQVEREWEQRLGAKRMTLPRGLLRELSTEA
jgi:hypothetical protein